ADLNGVIQIAREVLNLGQEFTLSESLVHGHYFLGISHYERNELATAQNHLVAVAEAPYVVNAHNFAFSAFALALTYQARGRPDDARRTVKSVVSHALETHNTSLLHVAQAFQAELALRQGRITEINHWTKSFNPDPFIVAYRFYVPQMTLAKWFLTQNTEESQGRAAGLLSRLHDFFTSSHN
ncbi:MAG: tetratricopeptide repeat protein, partial [Planctomycetes bacterium]|nr:tetratricopeptide repeat protein [Planctomycetota bacterium]